MRPLLTSLPSPSPSRSDAPKPTELQLAPMQHQQKALAAQMETHQHTLDLLEGVLRGQARVP